MNYNPIIRETNIIDTLYLLMKLRKVMIKDDWTYSCAGTDMEIRKWNNRCTNSLEMLYQLEKTLKDILNSTCSNNSSHFTFTYYINEVAVGFLLLYTSAKYPPHVPSINILTIHPGIRNTGYRLIEHAVNKSFEIGYSGNLKIIPMN
ncbi:hypothetical protein [Xenorhabdus lircayensis]|uniref:Uncharacterized protein n=1 Tax=Xenorhabdus lircayensis TaxID=2763499 RepID=A0ABS0UBE2_9GAMM|nr:hypothetical protein [Xenorhabdus lircayensis]MBI6550005.1 hypothetical protein [Xenorhabdus lircayensis]